MRFRWRAAEEVVACCRHAASERVVQHVAGQLRMAGSKPCRELSSGDLHEGAHRYHDGSGRRPICPFRPAKISAERDDCSCTTSVPGRSSVRHADLRLSCDDVGSNAPEVGRAAVCGDASASPVGCVPDQAGAPTRLAEAVERTSVPYRAGRQGEIGRPREGEQIVDGRTKSGYAEQAPRTTAQVRSGAVIEDEGTDRRLKHFLRAARLQATCRGPRLARSGTWPTRRVGCHSADEARVPDQGHRWLNSGIATTAAFRVRAAGGWPCRVQRRRRARAMPTWAASRLPCLRPSHRHGVTVSTGCARCDRRAVSVGDSRRVARVAVRTLPSSISLTWEPHCSPATRRAHHDHDPRCVRVAARRLFSSSLRGHLHHDLRSLPIAMPKASS